jgi:hypothetical protein
VQIPLIIEAGGDIPTLERDVPPDIPYDNFIEIKRRIIEGRGSV